MPKEGILNSIAEKFSSKKNSPPSRRSIDGHRHRHHHHDGEQENVVVLADAARDMIDSRQHPEHHEQRPWTATVGGETVETTTREPELEERNRDFGGEFRQQQPQPTHDKMFGTSVSATRYPHEGMTNNAQTFNSDVDADLQRANRSRSNISDAERRPSGVRFAEQTDATHTATVYAEEDEAVAREMQRLNNILSDYRAEVLTLEATNRRLIDDLQRIRQPLQAFEQFDRSIKETRQQQQSSWEQKETKIRSDYATLAAEAEDLKKRIDRVERERQEQLNRNNALQQHIAQQEADMGLLRLQNADGERRFGELQTEFNALNDEIKALRTELALERQHRDSFATQVQQLRTESEGYEQSVNELRREVYQVASSPPPTGEIVHSDLKEDVEQIRRDYEQSRDRLREQFEQRANEFYHLWLSENQVTEQLRAEVAELRSKHDEINDMHKEIGHYRSLVDALKHDYMVAQQKYTMLQQQYAADNSRWQQLKTILEGEHQQLGNRSKLYGEVAIYRDILEGKLLDTPQHRRDSGSFSDYIDDDGHRHRTLTEEEKRLRAERNAAIEERNSRVGTVV